MGMYSSFLDEDIEVIDEEGLKEYLLNHPKDEDDIVDCLWKDKDIKTFSFNGWDSHKLISYWYNETLEVLRDLAVFIEGYAKFEYETGEEFATINFSDGKCNIDIGVLQYSEHTLQDLWAEVQSLRGQNTSMPPLSDELNARLIAFRKL